MKLVYDFTYFYQTKKEKVSKEDIYSVLPGKCWQHSGEQPPNRSSEVVVTFGDPFECGLTR